MGSILGGGGSAAASTAGTAASGAAGAAGGVGSASQAAGSVASGLAGVVNMVSGIATAVSSVVGNFQMAGMNKSLDLIVNHTLRIFNSVEQFRMDAWDREGHLMLKLDDMWNAIRDVSGAIRTMGTGGNNGKGAIQVNVYLDGKAVWSGLQTSAALAGIQ